MCGIVRSLHFNNQQHRVCFGLSAKTCLAVLPGFPVSTAHVDICSCLLLQFAYARSVALTLLQTATSPTVQQLMMRLLLLFGQILRKLQLPA